MQDHSTLVQALRNPAAWRPELGDERVQSIETHISSVILAGDFAYKVKKPLDLGFLDFSTLERRRFCCEEELRLNARLAPSVYLDVLAVTGTAKKPVMGGEGEPIEYAVKMRRFDPEALLSKRLDRLTPELIDAIADRAAAFHGKIPSVDASEPYGTPEAVLFPMQQNFDQIRALVDDPGELARLAELETWTRTQYQRLERLLAERRAGGFIRECHGDMHLGNMALEQGEVIIFDGIEFNPSLRWIDTVSEVAFLVMDLDEKGRPELGRRFLDRYLARTGDYAGLRLLRFYQVYRAMVRAKVAAIRLGQPGLSEVEKAETLSGYAGYADLAQRYTRPDVPALVITHGVSGSGKSRAAAALVEGLGAVRVRSDVERKRLAGLAAEQASGSELAGGIYTPELTLRTYDRLRQLCALILEAGLVAVADAAFLKRDQRLPFGGLAAEHRVPFVILTPEGEPELFRRRVKDRAAVGADPSEATLEVLEAQLRTMEPLAGEELEARFSVPAQGALPVDALVERLSERP
jgi:aminoglycoside phosphotransferase family enzyme/predicted kinase